MTEGDIIDKLKLRHSKDVFVPKCKTGPTWINHHLRILDAWTMKKTWMIFDSIGYEIKVSRGDFKADKKWPDYLEYCNRFFFVCPWGMIDPGEIENKDVGLMWVCKTGDRIMTKKRSQRREIEIPVGLILHVIMSRTIIMRKNEYYRLIE